MDTILINIIGGPGTGKSILTSDIFSKLKRLGIPCEIASEYIKDKIYDESKKSIENQIYIFGKQHHKLFRLRGKVRVIITDSPIIFCSIYDSSKCSELKNLIMMEFNKWDSLNYLILRNEEIDYEQAGRMQDLSGAKEVDKNMLDFLEQESVPYQTINGIGEDSLNKIVSDIINKIK